MGSWPDAPAIPSASSLQAEARILRRALSTSGATNIERGHQRNAFVGREVSPGVNPWPFGPGAGRRHDNCYKLLSSCILAGVLDKGKPAARWGRKARGPLP